MYTYAATAVRQINFICVRHFADKRHAIAKSRNDAQGETTAKA